MPTYNFGVVVDDLDMAMTHVIRGDDHVNNTPRQINLYRALGARRARTSAHVPMILGADGQRLSKRHGAVSVLQYRDEGYLPEALVNYLARLGWSHGDEEVFSRAQLVEWFDLEHVSRSPARWDPEKLKWLNGEYLKRIPAADLVEDIRVAQSRAARRDRRGHGSGRDDGGGAGQLGARGRARGVPARAGFRPSPRIPRSSRSTSTTKGRAIVGDLAAALEPVEWSAAGVKAALQAFVKERGLKMPEVMMPLRVAVTRKAQTKAIDAIVAALRKDVVLQRLRHAAAG